MASSFPGLCDPGSETDLIPPPPAPTVASEAARYRDGRDTPAPQPTETRLGLAARRAAQLPKLKDLSRKNRQESLDDPSNNEPDLDFQYGDSDTFVQELAELYSYSERDEFVDNYRSFTGYAERRSIFHWAPLSQNVKRNFILSLLEELEMSDADRRCDALRIVAYLLQGNFMDTALLDKSNDNTNDRPANFTDTKSKTNQEREENTNQLEEEFILQNVCDNAFLLYELGLWPTLCMILALELENTPNAMKNAEPNARRPSLTSLDCRTLRLILSCLYTIVESIRWGSRISDEQKESADIVTNVELNEGSRISRPTVASNLAYVQKLSPVERARRIRLKGALVLELGQPVAGSDQSLPILLFDMVAKCCSGTAPHYPMRKTLLLLWKTVLTLLGGWDELKEMKNEARRQAELAWCEDTLSIASMMQAAPPPQLPIFVGGGAAMGMNDGESNSDSGIQLRRPPLAKRQLACTPCDGDDNFLDDEDVANANASAPASGTNSESDSEDKSDSSNTVAGTPMPSRSQSPDPNEQCSSTNTSLFPPKCLPWTPKIRQKDMEQFLERERYKFFGFQLPDDHTTTAGLPAPIAESMETLKRHVYVSLSEIQIKREELLAKYIFSQGSKEPEVINPQAEELYVSMLAQIPQYIIGLLKILLAAAPTSKAKTDAINLMAEVVPPNDPSSDTNGPGKEQGNNTMGLITNVDISRHKEIMVKSISALILLLLKHFKLNHVYQLEYVSQHLVFANCIPLILKFFDQNIMQYVQKANELKQLNFPYCVMEYAKLERETSPANGADETNSISKSTTMIACGADFILQTCSITNSQHQQQQQVEYMWRNLFSAVNLLRILNKLTKWKHARTMMLVVFKSAPVLKRSLRVKHILLQLYALKLLKMQAKYLGRQWRKTNMELMSAIYSKVRHRLNDDWAYGNETQAKPWDFQSEEAALRNAVEKFNLRRYGNSLSLAVDGEPSSAIGQQSQFRYRPGSPLDSNGSQNDVDGNRAEQDPFVFDAKDPEYQPIDNNIVSVLGVHYELTEQFKRNCERWVEREVMRAKIDWDQLLKPNA